MVAIRHPRGAGFGSVLDQLFQDALGGWGQSWPNAAPSVKFPALNVWQDEEAFHVQAELPGVKREDLELSLKGREFRIAGERKRPAESKPVHDERAFGRFERVFSLPEDLNPEGVKVDLRDGILHATLPKAPHAKTRRIDIQEG